MIFPRAIQIARLSCLLLATALAPAITASKAAAAEPLSLTLRERGEYSNSWSKATWDPAKTAIIVCDMWDSHHSVTAVRRVNEFAPRLNSVLMTLRARGATIIHSPSDCMPAYQDHPARSRALATAKARKSPPDMEAWCHRIPGEEASSYPIDQSDGGEDEDAWENAQWAAVLEAQGRNPGNPWQQQTDSLEISAETDYIAAEGDVVWNILEARGIEHVILCGVHTNMCVLGRPFGLRQMVRAGKETVLLRDCTDVMYNPARWPYVSHFTGLDLVVGHIERHVCPTITSDQIVGGKPFRFAHDKRPTLAILTSSSKAPRWRQFARRFLDAESRVLFVLTDASRMSTEGLSEVDAILIDSPDACPEPIHLAIRKHAASAKPLLAVGLIHSSLMELFGCKLGTDQDGSAKKEGRKEVGSKEPRSEMTEEEQRHPLAKRHRGKSWTSGNASLRGVRLAEGTMILHLVRVAGSDSPVPGAWTWTRPDSGRSICLASGFTGEDGQNDDGLGMLRDAVYWASGRALPVGLPADPDERRAAEGWHAIGTSSAAGKYRDLRTLLRTPVGLDISSVRSLEWEAMPEAKIYLNGKPLPSLGVGKWTIPAESLRAGDLNLFVVRLGAASKGRTPALQSAPRLVDGTSSFVFDLVHWQERRAEANASEDVTFPIPPQFGAPTDLIQNWR